MTKTVTKINSKRLLERFIRYVKIDTAADSKSNDYPSSASQKVLGAVVRQELQAMGVADAHQDEFGLVWGTIPASQNSAKATVALLAHLDTSPEAPSANIDPQVVPNYNGGEIELPNGLKITLANTPELESVLGHTLVTTDGRTLLGGDDKAGVAIIMELAQTLIENPDMPTCALKLLFTCDEEIGHGTDKIDLQKLGADVAYTIDGGGAGDIDVETFSADAVNLTFSGYNIHPAIAKDRMINAVRAASAFVASLPTDRYSPETTDERDGFIHPHSITGGVGEAKVELIVRAFELDDLAYFHQLIHVAADQIAAEFPGLKVSGETREQYRNLAEGLKSNPNAVGLAVRAFENLKRPYQLAVVRGGTDGSQLTEKGLPTPNLSSGQHNIHSVLEFASLNEMVASVEHLLELLKLWSEN